MYVRMQYSHFVCVQLASSSSYNIKHVSKIYYVLCVKTMHIYIFLSKIDRYVRDLRSFSIHKNRYHGTAENNVMSMQNLFIDNCEHLVDLPLIVSPYGNLILCVGYIYPINDVILCTEK